MDASHVKVALKTIRYGTVISPSIVRGVIGRFPGRDIDFSKDEASRQFPDVSFHDVERVSKTSSVQGRYPSISTILGCTQSQRNLYWWQLKMIKQLNGEGAFRRYMKERVQIGMAYHTRINKILSDFRKDGSISRSDDELLEGVPDTVIGFIRSVLPILRSLKHSHEMQMEQYVQHHILYYYGRFDAVIRYRDAFFLIDWKTASVGSSKDANVQLSKMYGDPLQVAAYVGAVNSDPNFSNLPTIRNGAVIVAKEDGSTAQVAEMGFNDLNEYWHKWLQCVHRFWYELATRPSSRGVISFVSRGD
ncbi:Mitochondrial genome maintenance exonuclease 1 [Toxocara canis]|uniref:Mitochondrial genome maintenance exonuclease 1 n=1 Tax=Toxocara canis TaxID=6265 RepID=A0A0B2V263_TOXCA|nr:Mitochondrial genome maintenance exonuclease 1 [Toxocara canis]